MPDSFVAVIRGDGEEGVVLSLQEERHDPYRVIHYRSLDEALEDNPGYDWRLPDSNAGGDEQVLRVAHFLQ